MIKKLVSGLSFMLIGSAGVLIPIKAAIPLTTTLQSWSGSKLWYILFSSDFLDLKIVFFFFSLVFLVGFVLTLIACFGKDSK